jgi:molybdopterin synthase catalytic subunit
MTDSPKAVVRLAALRATPLSVDEVVDAVKDPAAGGLVVFIGSVRDNDDERDVDRLDYEAHPSAEALLREVAERVAVKHPVTAVAVTHRVGHLAIGDIAVVVAASCPHRGEAFAAARELIDDLKATVPIWKHQLFSDGGEEWVGTP